MTKQLRFKKIDAFASEGSSGNPAAVIYLDRLDDISDDEKLRIAKELNGYVSEVGYVSPGTETDYDVCYFSAEREVAFCGHATIAIMNDIVATNEAMQSKAMLSIATRTARLSVENRFRDEKSVYISAPSPVYSSREIQAVDVANALNTRVEDVESSLPIQLVNGGLETLIVPMKGLDSILSVVPDLQTLNAFCRTIGADIVLLFSSERTFGECSYRTRVFAPTFGYVEDPATGSGNAAFGYYLLAHRAWNGEQITLEQNGDRKKPNFVRLFSRCTDAGETRVWFGGGALVKIDGQYELR
jgi:PhzF family phenazine biosynthesis protein